jgi:hypothetical protein
LSNLPSTFTMFSNSRHITSFIFWLFFSTYQTFPKHGGQELNLETVNRRSLYLHSISHDIQAATETGKTKIPRVSAHFPSAYASATASARRANNGLYEGFHSNSSLIRETMNTYIHTNKHILYIYIYIYSCLSYFCI